jgi:hypothetical protein
VRVYFETSVLAGIEERSEPARVEGVAARPGAPRAARAALVNRGGDSIVEQLDEIG